MATEALKANTTRCAPQARCRHTNKEMALENSLTPSLRTQHVRGKYISVHIRYKIVHNIGTIRSSEVHVQLHSFTITEMW